MLLQSPLMDKTHKDIVVIKVLPCSSVNRNATEKPLEDFLSVSKYVR